jgi:hypothetical protein
MTVGAISNQILPAEMSKSFVGLGHLMDFVAFADGIALALVGFEDFGGERFAHGRAFAGIREIHDPAQGERGLPVAPPTRRALVSMRGLVLSTARCKISTGLLAGFLWEMVSKAP